MPRNFGRRGATDCVGLRARSDRRSQQSGLGNCLSKTQVCAKSLKTTYADRRLPNTGRLRGPVSRKAKLVTEAPVNGGPNYEGLPGRSRRFRPKGPSLNLAVCGNTRVSSTTRSASPLMERCRQVTMCEVRKIRRKPRSIRFGGSSETVRQEEVQ